ncbi:MAG: ABC transporter ATP-binding protein [Bacilli bacterium]|nr:ABC transporter ATP-binding protein [Bacilli bacterium]
MSIEIDHLSFRYSKNAPLVLNDLSLEVTDGSLTVLLGLNGCGKTTLIKLLSGLEKPTGGTVSYDGKPLSDISIKERSRVFAYVSQHANVMGEIPVKQYLLYGTSNTLAFYQRPGKEEEELVDSVAERLHISHLLEKRLDQISGGELQIALIACAIIQRTPVILLDEPTSALDLKNQSLVLSVLKEIATQEKKTIVLSTHNPNHALFLGSDVVLINEGQIKGQGKAANLVTKQDLEEIYGDRLCLSEELPYKEISFR